MGGAGFWGPCPLHNIPALPPGWRAPLAGHLSAQGGGLGWEGEREPCVPGAPPAGGRAMPDLPSSVLHEREELPFLLCIRPRLACRNWGLWYFRPCFAFGFGWGVCVCVCVPEPQPWEGNPQYFLVHIQRESAPCHTTNRTVRKSAAPPPPHTRSPLLLALCSSGSDQVSFPVGAFSVASQRKTDVRLLGYSTL